MVQSLKLLCKKGNVLKDILVIMGNAFYMLWYSMRPSPQQQEYAALIKF